ncbi:class I SAM-dependent methyltransferase [Planomicrobium sp. YIM 101495]|uniref:class I SAM-dependent methyltransferase n=1 Tax=Planomicrobium sp. YIM 101495 TaxID=2665160 RepID=UPI0012B7D380|nr:class I SAM-dependent methyltransferase [Planomicrobium sp. YIM 101495]MTD31864.1 methyltransferase domain-containing protein [Planomicrobium sp. YIM 101495]
MTEQWTKPFYKEQFEMINPERQHVRPGYLVEDAQLLLEQAGKDFKTALELGSGNGYMANELAALGKRVTTIELVEELHAFAALHAYPAVTPLCGDFYTIELPETFDAVLYLDGFGVGDDADQLRLLFRIRDWMKDDGFGLIDIYQPDYWRKVQGTQMRPVASSDTERVYGFEEDTKRMTDTWWRAANPEASVTQSLACYTPGEIHALCEQAGLQVTAYFPGGAMDFEKGIYHEVASLDDCLAYRIKVKKK